MRVARNKEFHQIYVSLDNEASAGVRHIIAKNNVIFQLVEPYNKYVNTAGDLFQD